MLLKTSIVCLLFSIYMIGFYYRKPHIPVKSTKVFQQLIGIYFPSISVYEKLSGSEYEV